MLFPFSFVFVLLQQVADSLFNQIIQPFLFINRQMLKFPHKMKIKAETILFSYL